MIVLVGAVGCLADQARRIQRCLLLRWQRLAPVWVPRVRRAGHVAVFAGLMVVITVLDLKDRADRLGEAPPPMARGSVADSGTGMGHALQRWDVTVADLPDPGPTVVTPWVGFRELADLSATPAADMAATGTAGGVRRGARSASAVQISPVPAAAAVTAAAVIGVRQVRRRKTAPITHDPGSPPEGDGVTADLDQKPQPADAGTDIPGPSAAETGTPTSDPVDERTEIPGHVAAARPAAQVPPSAVPEDDTFPPQPQEPHAASAGVAGAPSGNGIPVGGGDRSGAAASEARPLSRTDSTSRVVLFTAARWGNRSS